MRSKRAGTRLSFGIMDLVILVACCGLNFWLFSFGPAMGVLAAILDKHFLVAYLCMKLRVDG
jgi:hypothetical protein